MKTAVLQTSVSVITSFGFIFFSTVFADNFLLLDLLPGPTKEQRKKLRFVQHHIAKTLRHLMATLQLAASCGELYFSRCCALKRTGTFASESKVTCLLKLNFNAEKTI